MANNNVINVKALMKDMTSFNVSKNAVDDFKGFIEAWFEHAVKDMESIAKSDKRTTILDRDVQAYLNLKRAYMI